MSDYEAKVRTKVGEFTIHFSDKADLETKLAQIPEFASTLESKLGTILVKEPDKVVGEYADLYAMGPDGIIKLLKYPKKKAKILRLAAFLSPKPLGPSELKQVTGVGKPLDYMKDGFDRNPDGTYSLNAEGKTDVTSKIIPSLRGDKKTK